MTVSTFIYHSSSHRALCFMHIPHFSPIITLSVLVAQLCLPPCDPMDCRPPVSSVHGILYARILEWVAISFSRGSSWPRDRTRVSCIAGRSFTILATWEALWHRYYLCPLSFKMRKLMLRQIKWLAQHPIANTWGAGFQSQLIWFQCQGVQPL